MVQQSRYSPSYGEIEAWLEASIQSDSNPDELEKIAAKEEALRDKYKASVGDYLANPESDYRHPSITISQAQHEEMLDLVSEMEIKLPEQATSIASGLSSSGETAMVQEARYSPSYGELENWLEARMAADYNTNEMEQISVIKEELRYCYVESVNDPLAAEDLDYRHPDITISPAQHKEMLALISELATNRIDWARSIAPTVRQIHQIISAESGSESVETNHYLIDLDPASEALLLYSKQEGTELARFRSQSDEVIYAGGLRESDFTRFDEGRAQVKDWVERLAQKEKGVTSRVQMEQD